MNNMKNLDVTVILPIKSAIVREFDSYLFNAVNSVLLQKFKFKKIIKCKDKSLSI